MESCFLIFPLLFAFSLASGERTLKFVTVLYRHGDRSPVKAYPTDPYQESDWPQGFGQLSQEGMRQHFELGNFLRKRYTGFLSEDYERHEIFIRSTDVDRTLMSAEANLAGLFPPNGSEVFRKDLKWQPIPVHTVPEDKEKLLLFPLEDCPRYKQLMNETEKSDIFLNMTDTYKDFIEMVRNKTGLIKASIETIWSVHDTLFCEAKHGMQPPPWVTPNVMEKLGVLKNFGFQIMFGVYKRKEKCRLQGGLLLEQIIKNISAAAAPDSKQEVKMIVYSAHDTTILALQEAMNVFNGLQPPYASCHLIELYQEENGSFSVEMFYRNDSSVPEPYAVSLPGCSQRCPLEDFLNLTHEVIPQDWKRECQISKEATDTEVIIGLAVCGCLLFLLILLLFVVLCHQKEQMAGYSNVINESDS
ncbi:lysosomal acid phosphatase isoform X1 [Myxocyprinus asiaticus]|uniref:lysosomal acid phosphatase isoform X1 n=2 Tax=Myxocyprinus asiaticus TaxID=70543 RepID=UPI002223CC70|nr:lysosomal acid phosphatase isoform X1 [Myxocyprinus asiaticus]XP_051579800.1 lysosomal acid phosphatase isoform X1 [Myxocyprinus asiaticus]